MGGNTRLFVAAVSEINTFPFSGNAFTGNITFAAGKGFYEFDCAPQSIDVDVKPDGNFFKHSISCQVPGLTSERDEILYEWNRTPLIVLRKDSNGNFFVHGSKNYPIYLISHERMEKGSFASLKCYNLGFSSLPAIPTGVIPYSGVVTIEY